MYEESVISETVKTDVTPRSVNDAELERTFADGVNH